jgi:inorganic triphosphatase YgiF
MDCMKTDLPVRPSQEVELKLALTVAEGTDLAQLLGGTPPLRRHKAKLLQLHNVYYDTPDQLLRQQRIALRLRRVGEGAAAQWLQTLKISDQGDSALSQRGEWELPVAGAALSQQALAATPWSRIDPHGVIFAALKPCFVTRFERRLWLLRGAGGSLVEVALDQGQVLAGEESAAICELELELKAGAVGALFDLAQQLAASVAMLPLHLSKAQRGFALAQHALDAPLRAQPPVLDAAMPLPQAATRVLREMFCQFSANLLALHAFKDPELVHQARVGWRRFRSALKLFRRVLPAPPATGAELATLLAALGALRDLDVARLETLPALSGAFIAGDARRERAWQQANRRLTQAATVQRAQLLQTLETPALGAALLGITRWLEEPDTQALSTAEGVRDESLRHWSRRRVARLHVQLQLALKDCATPAGQHRARILAKRLRYGIEALRPLLSERRTRRWYQQAVEVQTGIGAQRDLLQAARLLADNVADRGLAEFLRGVAAGRN